MIMIAYQHIAYHTIMEILFLKIAPLSNYLDFLSR